jgi:hypothetical protein
LNHPSLLAVNWFNITLLSALNVNASQRLPQRAVGHPSSRPWAEVSSILPSIQPSLFANTSGEKLSDDHFKVAGSLTIHGVTKPVVLDTDFFGLCGVG